MSTALKENFLVAIGGLSGSGKSTLAKALRDIFSAQSQTVCVSPDAVRKSFWHVPPSVKLPEAAYSATWNTVVYKEVDTLIRQALADDKIVITDSVFATEFGRGKAEESAAGYSRKFIGVWLDAPVELLHQRVEARENDVSDADVNVVNGQQSRGTGNITWNRLDASQDRQAVLSQALQIVEKSTGLNFQ